MFKEYKHMEDMEVLSVIDPDSLTTEQKKKSLRSVNLIKLKRRGKLKVRMCDDEAPHCKFILREEAKLQMINM